MKSGNLIPAYRLQARVRMVLMRGWSVGIVAYVGLLAFASPFVHIIWADDPTLAGRLEVVSQEIEKSEKNIETLEAQCTLEQATLNATRLVENQSDWSILLAILAGEVGDDIVLKTCSVEPEQESDRKKLADKRANPLRSLTAAIAGSTAEKSSVEPSRFIVEVDGFGLTQRAVSQFVLRLEASDLFEKVTLEETRREAFMSGEAIAFQLKCHLNGCSEGGS